MAIVLNLVGDFAIYQGETYQILTLHYPEDISNWTPRGQIRRDYLYKSGELLASFHFRPLIWAEVNIDNSLQFRTIINPFLLYSETINLPIPKVREEDEFKPGNNCWVYDIELLSPSSSETIKLVRGYVDVIPEVTDN